MTILVTGSRGAIGNPLKEALANAGEKIIGFDHGYDTSHTEYGDINNQKLLSQRISEMNIEGIIHLAALSRVHLSQGDQDKCFHVNVDGSANVFKSAYQSNLKPWVIYASTREVYGQQNTFPVKETVPLSPCNVYGESKMKAEEVAKMYQNKGVKSAVIRLSAVYGSVKHYQENKVVTSFCRRAILNEDIDINGAKNVFDFIHIDDVIKAMMLTVEHCRSGKNLPPVNICSGVGTSLESLAQMIVKYTQSMSKVVRQNADESFTSRFIGCPDLALNLLDWQPLISLDKGIQKFIKKLRPVYI